MKTSPTNRNCLNVPQWHPHFVLTFLLALITGACGGGGSGGGGGGGGVAPPPPPPAGADAAGAVYVFTPDAAMDLAQQAYIKASNTDADDQFGWLFVALSGDTLVVASHHEESAATGIDGDQSDNSIHRAGAAYVFTRNAGVWSQQAYIKASNTGADDAFGIAFALSGDTLAVSGFDDSGATGVDGDQSDSSVAGSGAVYVFTRTAGVWSQQAYIKASNTATNIFFGTSIALSGDTLAVSTPWEDSAATGINGDQSNTNADGSGAVYVFTRTAGVWSQQAYIKASNTDAFDEFGTSIALSGDTLAVGAHEEQSAATGIDGDQSNSTPPAGKQNFEAGAVYVFTRTAGVWSQQAYIKASNTDDGDHFGVSVALSGDTLAVGTRFEDSAATGIDGDESDNSAADAGAVYVFTRTAGAWSQQAYIKASNTDAGDGFGVRVALSGDRLAVGARFEGSAATSIDGDETDNSAANAGAVYLFTRNAGVWSQTDYVKASNTDAGDEFGASIALSGDTLAVGASQEDSVATGIDGDQSNTGFSGTFVSVQSFDSNLDAISPGSNDVIRVAVLGSANFDATQVDFSTIVLGSGNASAIRDGIVMDVNHDGIVDMVFDFNIQVTGIACGDINASLSGETFGGDAFTGTYSVKTAGCR